MRRWFGIGFIALTLVLLAGVGMMYVSLARANANRVGCQNNLRMLAMLGMPFEYHDGRLTVSKDAKKPGGVWPGTVMNEKLTPDERLSWVVFTLPTLSEPNLGEAWKSIDRTGKWDAPANKTVGETVLRTLICPAAVPPLVPGEPAPTMYVGIAGLGADAATLPLTDPLSPRAGAFRYDSATPFETVMKHNGVSQTFLYGQTTSNLGPWIRGGPSTVRGVLEDSPILARQGGQFGGALSEGSFFAYVDGSVRMFRYGADPAVLKSHATIAGGSVPVE